jgi:hypothetical protein
MTNRLGRIIDKSRALLTDKSTEEEDRQYIDQEVNTLWTRANFMRTSILLSCCTCLGAACLISMLFLSSLLDINTGLMVELVFSGSLLCLMISLVFFMLDVNLNLVALKTEMKRRGFKRS